MEERLKNNYLQLYYGNTVFNPKNSPPFSVNGQSTYSSLGTYNKKEIDFKFNLLEAEIDIGYLNENKIISQGLVQGEMR
jgi:hypothetical protein